MITLKERYKCPPNGFQFVQPETNWGEGQKWWDFEQLCRELYNHRVANPRFNLPTDINHIRAEVDRTNALRCLSIKGADIYVVQDQSTVPKYTAPHLPQPAVGGGSVSTLAAGVDTLKSWMGKGGKPVSELLSNARAEVCVKCPKNGKGGWTHYFTVPAAAVIQREVEYRNRMKLSTPSDSQLGVCEACLCPLKLKVHTPLSDIIEHMPDDVKAALDPGCWILHEQ